MLRNGASARGIVRGSAGDRPGCALASAREPHITDEPDALGVKSRFDGRALALLLRRIGMHPP
jgi:hypothetical protein